MSLPMRLARSNDVSNNHADSGISKDGRRHHECEILGEGPEAAESESSFSKCQKNPGHKNFISANDCISNYLPRLKTGKQRDNLKALLDLTVRLRIHWTSPDRSDKDVLAEYRGTSSFRTGTGYIRSPRHPVYGKPCPCDVCDGIITNTYWTFTVTTAHHVVFNSEEAKNTKVDLFCDDECCHLDGRMKTVWGFKMEYKEADRCSFECVSHDEGLYERILSSHKCSLVSESELYSLSDLGLLPSRNLHRDAAMIISHPHGQPKKITVGYVRSHSTKNLVFKYNTATCPGSSGAPVYIFDPRMKRVSHDMFCTPVHCGSCTKKTKKCKEQQEQVDLLGKICKKLRRLKTETDQINYGTLHICNYQ